MEGQDAKSAKVSGMFFHVFSYIKVHMNDKMKQKLYEIFTFDKSDGRAQWNILVLFDHVSR